MLSNVHVKNFALIDEADIGLKDNLNILTGETGAGKSILLGAINLALGARTSKDAIRTGADYCLAELTFTGLNENVISAAAELGIDLEDDELVVSRKLNTQGKSVVRINGETLNAAAARRITGELIDIYGQNEHQSLSNPAKHLEFVDRFLGPSAVSLKEQISSEYSEYSGILKELSGLENDPAMRARETDRIRSELREIEIAELKEGEEEALKDEHRVLANAGLITEALGNACGYLYNDEACSDMLSGAIKALSRVSELDETLSGFTDELSEIDSRVSDVYRELKSYLEELPDSAARLMEVEERLDLYSRLKRKFGNTVDDIYAYYDENKARLEKLMSFETYVEQLESRLEISRRKLSEHCDELSRLRQEAAEILKRQIAQALSELNFNKVSFDIAFTKKSELHADGTDEAEFMISLNPGEELKPLRSVASGGEMSRIMLAVKSVFAKKETIGTLIFDEIDAGISGITAQRVSEKLSTIALEHQVICITHLPQIASMADSHFRVSKTADETTSVVTIEPLDRQGAIAEIGRLLGGDDLSGSVLETAAQIKDSAAKRKSELRSNL